MAKVLTGLCTWSEMELEDLRTLEASKRSPPPDELPAGQDLEAALLTLKEALGLQTTNTLTVNTKVGDVIIHENNLRHIVEKRQDARERYALYALDTLNNPFEIWRAPYDDGIDRYLFIGAFAAKRQMLVVVSMFPDGTVLWNFMHSEAKALNKHRHGTLEYAR